MNAARQAEKRPVPAGQVQTPQSEAMQSALGRETASASSASSSASASQDLRDRDLLSALAGTDASRDRAVAHRTRRVVLSSLGVMREEKEDRSRARGVALAVLVLVLLLIAPLVWEITDSFIAGEHPGDPGSQLALWAGVVCCTMLAAALVAGWWKNRA